MRKNFERHHARAPLEQNYNPRHSGFPLQKQDSSKEFVEVDRGVRLITNAYNLDSLCSGTKIHEYKMFINPARGQPTNVLNRNFVTKSLRQLIMRQIIPELSDTCHQRGSVIIGYHLDAIYSIEMLGRVSSKENGAKHETEFSYENLLVETDLLSQLHVNINIKYSRQINYNCFDVVTNLKMSILHHKLLLSMTRYGPVYYSDPETALAESSEYRLDLISQHIMGISLSGVRRFTDHGDIVVINCTHSYITKPYRITDLLSTYMTSRTQPSSISTTDRMALIEGEEDWFKDFCSILEGYKCRTSGPFGSFIMRFCQSGSASKQLMSDPLTNVEMTVEEHYRQSGLKLNYPNLPCLTKNLTNIRYYPLELCTLLPGQKVPVFRLEKEARRQLENLNKPRPDLFKHHSSQARNELASLTVEELNVFGLKLGVDPIETKGSNLTKPILRYKDRELRPIRDHWESLRFCKPMHLIKNWCVVNTTQIDSKLEYEFFEGFIQYCSKFGLELGQPFFLASPKDKILVDENCMNVLILEGQRLTNNALKFLMFVIDSASTSLNRLVHLTFDSHAQITTACLRTDSIMNVRQHNSIYRTLAHKVNARLGGTNVTYSHITFDKLSLKTDDLMIVGLDVTHPDNELCGVSIVGCAFTYTKDLFRHKSLVWPQTARMEIIGKMDGLITKLLEEYCMYNNKRLPKQLIIYRDGVSHEEFEKVKAVEVSKTQAVIEEVALKLNQPKPYLSYIIAQKRHTMRFFKPGDEGRVSNPLGGTLIHQDIVNENGREFYLYSNTSPQATARPLHYHVLINGLGIENLQKLTYFLCFNFGKCSGTLSMPSSLRYAHNAAYDARNRVIAAREFRENKFYTSKFFC